uniref:TSA: Wollemia nobilis Ref_Wollemi_Transcript_14131_941 transcribed RNA sequence n=1 Tax=Wollemia nobilis TaxID=56998 RepID=A0A0C9RJW8_9CONI
MASNLVYILVAALFIVNTHFCYGGQQEEPSTSSSVVVQGKVFCNTCPNPGASDSTYFIPGASVAVECSLNRKTATSLRVEGETDEMGEFKIEIPSLLHSKPERCSAQLIRSPHASCNVPSIATSPNFILTADLDGVRTYSAGALSYRPHIVPSVCYTKDSGSDIVFVHGRGALATKDSLAAIPDLPIPPGLVPPLPDLPVPPGLVPPIPGTPPMP